MLQINRKEQPGNHAARRVFNIPELLHMILLELRTNIGSPPDITKLQTLLLCQRVNKTFQTTITNSSELQRALWFKGLSHAELELHHSLGGPAMDIRHSSIPRLVHLSQWNMMVCMEPALRLGSFPLLPAVNLGAACFSSRTPTLRRHLNP